MDKNTVRIICDKATFEKAIAGNGGVRSCVRKWRAIQNKTANSYMIEITL